MVAAPTLLLGSDSLPEKLRPLVEDWESRPDWNVVKTLSTNELRMLLQCYQQQTNLVKRRAMTIALGLAGEERAVEPFIHTVTSEFAGVRLDTVGKNGPSEAGIMLTTIEMLGFLAAKSDRAFDFLKQAIDPLFWSRNMAWTTRDTVDEYGVMAGRSIASLSNSGRPSVAVILAQLRSTDLNNSVDQRLDIRRANDGAVVDAAFLYDIMTKRGLDYVKSIYGNEAWMALWNEWQTTVNGKEWQTWSDARRVGKP